MPESRHSGPAPAPFDSVSAKGDPRRSRARAHRPPPVDHVLTWPTGPSCCRPEKSRSAYAAALRWNRQQQEPDGGCWPGRKQRPLRIHGLVYLLSCLPVYVFTAGQRLLRQGFLRRPPSLLLLLLFLT